MNPSVLIVEDDPEVLSLLQYTLSKEKFKVYTAENGKKALEILDTLTPDVITLDLMLPALDSLDDIVKGFETGADDYLVKPFQLPELVARIKALYRRRHVGRSERM